MWFMVGMSANRGKWQNAFNGNSCISANVTWQYEVQRRRAVGVTLLRS